MSIRKSLDFRWDVLEIIVSGKSSIDSLHGFNVYSPEDATRFLHSYGFDLDNPIEASECLGHFHEATNFIRKFFLQPENPEGLRLELPRKILEITDVRDLFLYASLKHPSQKQEETNRLLHRNWACSILKVMHTIAHVDQDLRSAHFQEIQKQILDRFYRVVHRTANGRLFLGDHEDEATPIDLVAFETKPKKGRNSTLLKLLHKPENVAEDIFDRIGIRFITPTALGALQVIQFLQSRMIVVPPNIKPSRSRNTLLNLDEEKMRVEQLIADLDSGKLSEADVQARLSGSRDPHGTPSAQNPHSSEYYKSIQFTCRQLIKLKNPLYHELKELKSLAKTAALPEVAARTVERLDLKFLQKELRFFYPYEIQVVDQRSHEENERGRSAHSEYKRAQLQTALKRVMGTLATTSA